MDPDVQQFAKSYRALADAMAKAAEAGSTDLTPVGEHVQEFLGVPVDQIEPVTETFPQHQVVDLDLALDALLAEYDGARRGINGVNREHVESLAEFFTMSYAKFSLGAVAYQRQATGPNTDRRVVAFGLAEVRIDGAPLVWLQRAANPRSGRDQYTLEVMCPQSAVADAFLARVRDLMSELSTLRGQIISFAVDHFDHHGSGSSVRFLARPDVTADQVILPDDVLPRIRRHVVGVGEQREILRAAGQHLKRGVLLYGPPGTGKTHLIRHLLSETPGTTAVLLSGRTLGLLHDATALARAAQPAIIVLEDCDLVAEHRGGDSNAALFETLEAMDGLAADADITFILTTNRVDLLERALVERPGRVDLAVEIQKPDASGRERLFRLYAGDLLAAGHFTEAAVRVAADRTEGVTASFTKELIRRCVLNAAQDGRSPRDADVDLALDEMLSDAEALTRTLLGGQRSADLDDADGADEDWEGPHPSVAPSRSTTWHMSFPDP